MAKLINGINGSLQGTIGGVVGSSWKGIPYIKSAYKKRTKNISEKEKANRQKFAMAQAWLQPLLPFVRQGFKGYSPTVEGYLAAKKWLLLHAFSGEGAEMTIHPALVQVSHGGLPLPPDIAVAATAPGVLSFTWNTASLPGTNNRDQAMLLAYDVQHKIAYHSLYGAFRSSGTDTLTINTTTGLKYEVYLAFCAADRSRQSGSVYLGEWTV